MHYQPSIFDRYPYLNPDFIRDIINAYEEWEGRDRQCPYWCDHVDEKWQCSSVDLFHIIRSYQSLKALTHGNRVEEVTTLEINNPG